jgi:glycosyltransferase involved in cell wall biosynthesis
LTHTKGFDTLLEAAELLAADHRELTVMIVGGVDPRREGFAQELRRTAEGPALKGKVIFTGHRSDVGDFYPLFDVCVMASAFPEPFGRVALESLAAGTPVVMTEGSGAAEPFGDLVEGYLVPPRDARALASCLETVIGDADGAKESAKKMGEIVRNKLTVERMCSETMTVYRELLP